ncbi:MAG TPA: SLC13 family permease [Defluviitoga sp.]|nr:SLC13 family permease [Defluviitoga sp.]HOP24088.1 SLC13 family permease [Defluviitoga sp.]HPZ28578.1 SLC13 family permease [Defluviitoga sp.]HQD62384.1 SLC13 family permease [Defluviitoga sp.]
MGISAVVSLIVFVVVVIGILSQKVDKTLISMLGAVFLLVIGIFSQPMVAIRNYVDFNTLLFLVGIMLFVDVLKKTGLFESFASLILKIFGGNIYSLFWGLTIFVAIIAGYIEVIATILIFVPIALSIADFLEVNHLPFTLGIIFASQIGGMATMMGQPPNIMISSASMFTFSEFSAVMYPIAIINLVISNLLIVLFFKKDFSVKIDRDRLKNFNKGFSKDKKKFSIAVILFIVVVLAFIFHHELNIESSTVALAAGFVSLLLIGPKEVEEMLAKIEWDIILFIFALFVVVGALVETGAISYITELLVDFAGTSLKSISIIIMLISAFASAFMNNIAITAAFIPLVGYLPTLNPLVFSNLNPVWYALSLGTCLGGIATPVASLPNIIALTILFKSTGEKISFGEFFKYGFLIMILNIAVSVVYLNFVIL